MEPLESIPPTEEKAECLVSPRNRIQQARQIDAEIMKDVKIYVNDMLISQTNPFLTNRLNHLLRRL